MGSEIAPGRGRWWRLFRIAFAAGTVGLFGLALAGPALALTSSSAVTSPAGPYRPLVDGDNPLGPQTVSGTAAGPTAVDINCYYAPGTGVPSPAHLHDNVPVTAGQFSATISFSGTYNVPCVIRAVPHGDSTAYPPGQADVPYTGPNMFVTYVGHFSDGLRETTLYAYPSGENGTLNITSPGGEGLYYSTVGDPTNFSQSPSFFEGMGALLSQSVADNSQSDVRIDGANGIDPSSATSAHPGAPVYSFTNSYDPATGDLTLHEVNPYVKCVDVSCTSYAALGVELDRTWQTSHGDGVIAMTDVWRSTDGHAHPLSLDYEEQIQNTTNRSSFSFPGSPSFATHVANDFLVLPRGPGSIYMKDDRTTPDTGGTYAQGALTYASAPDGPVTFVDDDTFPGNDPIWTMPYTRTVPAGGSVTLRFTYEQAFAMPDVRSWATASEQSFAPRISIASPADGSSTTSPSVTVAGSASSDTGQLASVTVNGADAPLGADGSWSKALTLNPGANTITAAGTDQDGIVAQRQITVTYHPQLAPALSLPGGLHPFGGGARFTLSCAGAPCNGDAVLTTKERLRGKALVGVTAAKPLKRKVRTKVVAVGRATFTIQAGKNGVVTVSLNKTGKRLLKRFGKLPAKLAIRQIQANGHAVVLKSAKLVLKPAKKKRRSRH